jgi:CoA:oxalate CoA-transferase
MHLNGYPERPPLRVGVSIGDMVGGLYLALGVVAALRHRDATGEGQLLDVSLVDAQVALCENAIVRHSAFDEDPSRIGAQHPLIAPFGPYPSRDGFIVIANVKEWDLFCGLIERDDLALDPRFTTNRARLEHAQTLDDELARTLQTRTTDAWYEALRATNVCAVGKVNSIADLFDDPHVAAREMLVDLPLPYGVPGKLTVAGSPLKFSGTPVELQAGMPEYGGATDEVLAQWLGRDPGSTALLRERGVIR